MAPKSAQPYIKHLLIIEDDRGRKEVILENPTYSLGRASDCDLRIYSQFVSRYHATLLKCSPEDGYTYYRIIDGYPPGKTSVNGLMVNGHKVSSHDLKHGDQIVFGPQITVTYQYCHRDLFPTIPSDDPFDITLIDPAMMDNNTEKPSKT